MAEMAFAACTLVGVSSGMADKSLPEYIMQVNMVQEDEYSSFGPNRPPTSMGQ